MLSVHLYDLLFYAFHGVYEEESKLGNNYEVNLTVVYDERLRNLSNLSNLINYEELFEIVKKRMAISSPLLEEVAEAIIIKIRHQYSQITEIKISIFKLNPPIKAFQGKVGVTLHKYFE